MNINKIAKKIFLSVLPIATLSSCDTDIENIIVQHPIEKDATYYEPQIRN